ncbi:AI-2E family transporter [Tateyamaria omphalii]|uniref:AI-2E family transporter n=1 Tax=Tateyamaria omphalii TaxID=299262 RepID=A0A1P8MZT9_9RHOB|nr:AI-2E family transporter [Tateyamaria omphalii]APX13620.1 AI-2E family transporter [Tateyamaria omphalii]
MLFILTIFAVGGIMMWARPVLAPMTFALVVGIVASPLADRLHDWGVPRIAVAAALLVLTSGALVLGFVLLEPLLNSMAARLPEIRAEIEGWVQSASGLVRGIETISNEIEQTVGASDADGAAPELPTVMDALWLAPDLGASVLIFAGTLFFFMLTRTDLYAAAGRFSGTLFQADRAVARYFLAVSIVNVALGVAVAVVMSVIGLNNAVLWGLAAGLLNFILYLGPLTILFGLLIVGMVQFNGAYSLLPPFAFLCLNLIEAQFVTPGFVGQRLRISPLAVFVAIVIGLWLWGPVGAIVALPLTLWLAVLLNARGPADRAT